MRSRWSWNDVSYQGMYKETPGPRAKGPKWVSVLVTVVGYGVLLATFCWLIISLGGGKLI